MVVKYQPVLVTDLFIYGTQLHGEFYTNYQDMLDQLTRSIFIQTNQSVCRFFKIKLVWRNVKYTNFVISVMYWQCGKPFFSNTPKWRVDWNKYSPKWNRARQTLASDIFFKLTDKYQINNTVMFNNLFCRFWQVINLVKNDQRSLLPQFHCLCLLSFNARYKTCTSNPVPTHI